MVQRKLFLIKLTYSEKPTIKSEILHGPVFHTHINKHDDLPYSSNHRDEDFNGIV